MGSLANRGRVGNRAARKGVVEPLEPRQLMSAAAAAGAADELRWGDPAGDAVIAGAIARASDLSQYSDEQLAGAAQWVVIPRAGRAAADVARGVGARDAGPAGALGRARVFQFDGPNNAASARARAAVLAASPGVAAAFPLVARQQQPRFIPNDPMFANQWHLRNTGQSGVAGNDARVTTAWDSVRGNGVVIGIVDDGLQHTHPDLSANYSSSLSYDFNFNDPDPNPGTGGFDDHGTAVAGVAAGRGNNGVGVSGAAPSATLAGLRLIAGPSSDQQEANALSYRRQDIDIYSNSWGPADDGTLGSAGPLTLAALRDGVTQGRGGLGSIITWAGGNGLESDDNVNYDGYANSRYVIAVGALTDSGTQSWYSEPGAPLLVSAYSNGGQSGITTTDRTGADGYGGTDYTNSFGGTSSATPLVSGIIALMLERNPNLTWRDVQHVLVRSARQNDPTGAGWATNGAGLKVNHRYGFGAVDATAAVNLAATWTNVGPEVSATSGLVTVNQAIPDGSLTNVNSTVNITQDITMEKVEVVFNATHTYRGDLRVILTSPDGTQSVLSEVHGDGDANFTGWTFSSARHWGESSQGTWTLSVADGYAQDAGTFNSWQLNVYGTTPNATNATVVDRHVFYNNSAFDGNNTAANAQDDAAIATDKDALLPGQAASFRNYTSYSKGINGVMIDVAGLANPAGIGSDDVQVHTGNTNTPGSWTSGPTPSIATRSIGGGVTRITLTWADNSIVKKWAKIRLLNNADTGLAVANTFYFGNAIGESGNAHNFGTGVTSDAVVNGTDFAGARDNQRGTGNPAAVDFRWDYNRDRLVNGTDLAIARDNGTSTALALRLFTTPAALETDSDGTSDNGETVALRSSSPITASLRQGTLFSTTRLRSSAARAKLLR